MHKSRKFTCVLESFERKLSLSSMGYTSPAAMVMAYDEPCDPTPPPSDPDPTEPVTPLPCPGGPGGPIDPMQAVAE